MLMASKERDSMYWFSLFLSVLGLFSLAVLSSQQAPKEVYVTEIAGMPDGSFVQSKGTVQSSYTNNGHVFLTLCSGECVKIVVFSSDAQKISGSGTNPYLVKSGQRIVVSGEVSTYKGEKEIIASSLQVSGSG